MTFILTCTFTLLYFIRPFEVISDLRGMPILFVVGIIAGLSFLTEILSGKVKLFRNGTDQMMLGFYVAIGLSHLSHAYIGGAVESMQDFFPIFIGYFLIAHIINSEKKLKIFFSVLIISAVFLTCEGVLEAKNGISYFGVQPYQQGVGNNDDGTQIIVTRIKWVGPFSDPNDLAMVFVVVVPILLDYLLRRVIVIPLCLLCVVLYGLYLTNSRGGIISLLAAVFTYIILRYRSVKGLAVGLCLGCLLVLLSPSRMGNMSASEESAYGRLEAWYSGYQMFKNAPLMGVGRGMFTEYNNLTAHNSFVLVFSELGILGAFFFVGIFYFPILYGYQIVFKNTEQMTDQTLSGSYYAILGGLVGVMVSMFFLSRSYVLLPYMLVAVSMSILAMVTNSYSESITIGGNLFHYKRIFMLAVAGIICVNIFIKILL